MMEWVMRKQFKSIPPVIILKELPTHAAMDLRLVGSMAGLKATLGTVVDRETEL